MHLCVVVPEDLRPASSELPTPAQPLEPDQNCSVASVLFVTKIMMKMSATYPPLWVLLPCDDDDLSFCEGELVIVVGLTVVDGFHSADLVLHLQNTQTNTQHGRHLVFCLFNLIKLVIVSQS